MTKQDLIKKWEAELKTWLTCIENGLFHTPQEVQKAKHYSMIIQVMLIDIKKIQN